MSLRRVGVVLALAAVVGVLFAVESLPAQAFQPRQDRVVSANPANHTPHVLDGRVTAIVQTGDTVILGGAFTQVSSADGKTVYNRSNLVAFNATTGAVSTSFVPRADGEVTSLVVAPDGKSVYAGGFFDTIGGKASKSLARISLSDGALVSGFTPPTLTGRVKDLRLAGGRLWVAGTFTHVAGHSQPALVTLSPSTGARSSYLDLTFAGPQNGGALQVMKIDVTPDGSRLAAIGNFTTLEGATRVQIAMLDLTGSTAAVADWQTDFFSPKCSPSVDSYMRDLDFAPDGSYFVVTTTGAYGGSSAPCDTTTRWETGSKGTGLHATWVDYTGGDTLYAVAVTGTAVYVGGHFRWQNNPHAGDRAGPGAVGREGIAALDPENGLPLRWNPGRTKGVGVFDMLATSSGLWVGSDTDRIGNGEYHARIAFFPLSGGTSVPRPNAGALPGDVYSVPSSSANPVKRSYDGTTVGSAVDVPGGGLPWQDARGAFMLGDQLYAGWSDGTFTRRTFGGESYGTPTAVDTADQLVRDAAWHADVAASTGMFAAGGRLYYTVGGQSALYYRHFTVESDVVGAARFTASGNVDGIDFGKVSGMFVAGGKLYWGTDDGDLHRIDFAGGKPVAGTATIVSGPNVDGNDWRSRSTFLFTRNTASVKEPTEPNQAPKAAFTVSCDGLACTVDGRGSSDPDGSVASYTWDFGDGGAATGATASHTYTGAGGRTVKLTVTDDRAASAESTKQVSVAAPGTGVRYVGRATSNGSATTREVTIPAGVAAGDRLLLVLSVNSTTPAIGTPAGVTGWSGIANRSTSTLKTQVWHKKAAPTDAGRSVRVSLSGSAKASLTMVAYRGPGLTVRSWSGAAETTSRTTHTTPTLDAASGAWLVSYWGEKSSATTGLTAASGQTTRATSTGTGGGRIAALLTDTARPVATGKRGGVPAKAGTSSAQATMWSFLIGPGS